MTAVADLITDLRNELVESEESSLSTSQLKTAIKRGLMMVNRDFTVGYAMNEAEDGIEPDMPADMEQILLQASIQPCCRIMLAKAARRPNYKAGDLSIDLSRAVGAWRDLLASARSEYGRMVERQVSDELASLRPRLFERGITKDEENDYE
jgi:hypothetical protein